LANGNVLHGSREARTGHDNDLLHVTSAPTGKGTGAVGGLARRRHHSVAIRSGTRADSSIPGGPILRKLTAFTSL
jgi:hypothetical protein